MQNSGEPVMKYRSEDLMSDRSATVSASHHARVVLFLVAVCCLSIGVAIGAMVRGIAIAGPEDNRLTISNTPVRPDSLSNAFARVAEEVEPSVVHIKVTEGEERLIYAREGTGSGVIVNSSGYILTNHHVVRRASKITVKLLDGTEHPAKVVGQDQQTDLAVIKIEAPRPLPVARMGDSDKLNVGDWVLAIGSPFGLEQTVTAGIISAKDRDTDSGSTPFQKFLQTDAAINPGNSGGPLVSLSGEIVGINTQIATSSGVYNGIGFALPSSTAVDVYNQLITNGRVRRGFLGIILDPLTPQIARLNKIDDSQGVVVRELSGDNSPAARSGIQGGDVITAINDKKVKNVRELIRQIASLPVGSLANVTYIRNGERHVAVVKLEERQEDAEERFDLRQLPFDPRNPKAQPEKDEPNKDKTKVKPSLGISVKTLAAEVARQRGLEGARGAQVVSIEIGSVADDTELKVDDIIIAINYKPVTSLEDFLRMTRDLKSGDDVVLKVLRRERGSVPKSTIISFTMP
jgi:serine protease Do